MVDLRAALAHAHAAGPCQLLALSRRLMPAAHAQVRRIYQEPSASVEGLCMASAGAVRELFCVTDQEALVFMANVL